MCTQRESSITRDWEIVHRQRIQRLGSLKLVWDNTGRPNFGETVRDIKDENDEETIRRALYLEVSEEGVGAEEI